MKQAGQTSDEHRWQAGMGTIVGALAAETIAGTRSTCDDGVAWGSFGCAAINHAEDLLRGVPVAIDLEPAAAIATAVGLVDQASPLLMNPATVELIDQVRAWITGRTVNPFGAVALADANEVATSSSSFMTAIHAADSVESAILVGALRGLKLGVGDVPARLVSDLVGPDRRRRRRYLTRLTDRLLDLHRNDWYAPRSVRGPREVLPGLWVSNLYGLKAFVRDHPDGLVLSLCDIEARLIDHPDQITFHIDDTPKGDANPALSTVIDDLLAEVADARGRGQPVLVHCRHGASRTGLVLRLLLVDELDLSPEDALMEAQCLWPHTSTWNKAWAREIERRCS